MKRTVLFLALCMAMTITLQAQNKFFTKTGHIDFFSHTSVEDIKAANDQVTSFLDNASGELVFSVLSRSFQFEKPLMQEHFNENYMESDKFPKSSFIGKITDLKAVDFTKEGKYPVKVAGKLTIHGVTKDVEAAGVLGVGKDKIDASSVFDLKPEDYNISIPAVVKTHFADAMKVTVQMNYQLYVPKKL